MKLFKPKKVKLARSLRLEFRDEKDAENWQELSSVKKTHFMSRTDLMLIVLDLLNNHVGFVSMVAAMARGAEVVYNVIEKKPKEEK